MAARRSTKRSGRQIKDLAELIVANVLPGAGRAAGTVIADATKERLGTKSVKVKGGAKVLIASSVKVRITRDGSIIKGRVALIGPGASVGRWLEYGTAPHIISVRGGTFEGMSARRLNKRLGDGDENLRASLYINGKAVGPIVHHKGTSAEPFLRPAYDNSVDAAGAAFRNYIARRTARKDFGPARDGENDT
jgi:hypothetical protein